MSKQTLIAELIERLRSEKPEFFNKLRPWIVIIALAVLALIGLIDWFEIIDLGAKQDKITSGLWLLLSLLGGGYGVASLPTTKPELQDKKTKIGIIKETDMNEFVSVKNKN